MRVLDFFMHTGGKFSQTSTGRSHVLFFQAFGGNVPLSVFHQNWATNPAKEHQQLFLLETQRGFL